jgi:predicted Ser/Thr protein kinase
MSDVPDDLRTIGEAVKTRFDSEKRVLSYNEYLELVRADPYRHTRDAARYLHGCLDHFGSYEVDGPLGKTTRYRVFDLNFTGRGESPRKPDRRSDHLVGHEATQQFLHRTLTAFVREGRPNRLVLMHGPNGSAKSTFVACVMRGLEAYSQADAGAIYRFSWIFPQGHDGKGIGFSSRDGGPKPGETYAHLPEDRVQVKVPSKTGDHPLHLLPVDDRRALVRRFYREASVREAPPDWIYAGELSHKNRQIFEALLTAYRGDLARVLAHVQVERTYVSRRYRQGAVTIGPQMAVDASERQITADHSMGRLPASLSALTLFEPYGELVDASGGVIEYSDLLKRPLDAWKYLLLAIENGEVSLNFSTLATNAVMLASSNDLHLNAFREHPEYHSFRGRIALARVPYLLDFHKEQGIYDAQILPQVSCHVAPHSTFVAALWAVLTRLRRPRRGYYDDDRLGAIAENLAPYEKARLYAEGHVPARLGADDAKNLRANLKLVAREFERSSEYEGLTGASPREVRALLLDAAADAQPSGCLTPRNVLDALEEFCQRNDYDFLKQAHDAGYYDHAGFVEVARQAWLDRVEGELRASSGLVEGERYVELFERYINHASHWVKGERVFNPVTSKHEQPDSDLMERVEAMWAVGSAEEFRRGLLSTVANWVIEHPDQPVVYAEVFPRLIQQLESAYYAEHQKQLSAMAGDILRLLDEHDGMPAERRRAAEAAYDRLCELFGYQKASVRVALGELVSARY